MKLRKQTKEPESEQAQFITTLGGVTLDRLYQLHARYSSDGAIRDAMMAFYGKPEKCLTCSTSLIWEDRRSIPDDVDPWFCNSCCPICNGR